MRGIGCRKRDRKGINSVPWTSSSSSLYVDVLLFRLFVYVVSVVSLGMSVVPYGKCFEYFMYCVYRAVYFVLCGGVLYAFVAAFFCL